MTESEELHNMQLAAISTATVQNTVKSSQDRISPNSPYWTVAYGDVCQAIDREIRERNLAIQMEQEYRTTKQQLEIAEEKLAGANAIIAAYPEGAIETLRKWYAAKKEADTLSAALRLCPCPQPCSAAGNGNRLCDRCAALVARNENNEARHPAL